MVQNHHKLSTNVWRHLQFLFSLGHEYFIKSHEIAKVPRLISLHTNLANRKEILCLLDPSVISSFFLVNDAIIIIFFLMLLCFLFLMFTVIWTCSKTKTVIMGSNRSVSNWD